MATNSNTEKKLNKKGNRRGNAQNLHPFKPGKGADRDPRIWMGGRPSTLKQFSALLRDYLAQPSKANRTKLQDLIDKMADTRGERKGLLEYAFGKVPQPITGSGDGELKIRVTIKKDDAE